MITTFLNPRRKRIGCLAMTLVTACMLNYSQSVAPSTASAPPTAMAVASRSIAAMGGAAILQNQVVVLSGTLTVHGSSDKSFPITLKLHGTTQLRSELQTSNGTRVTVVSNGLSGILSPDGTLRMLSAKNSAGYRNEYLPALSLLSEYNMPGMQLKYMGSSVVDNDPNDVIAIGEVPAAGAITPGSSVAPNQSFFYVNSTSGLVSRMQKLHFAETETDSSAQVEIRYSNYQNVDGVMVPFLQETYVDGSLQMDLVLTSASFGNDISVSDFNIGK